VNSPFQHLLHFEGASALSEFRAQALLARLQAVCPRIVGVAARYVHWVGSGQSLDAEVVAKLKALLDYGVPYVGPDSGPSDDGLVVVTPRLGTTIVGCRLGGWSG
jgi:phosphoribosylformylglycinamidine synthase